MSQGEPSPPRLADSALPPAMVATLADLGFRDVAQLRALAEITAVAAPLAATLGCSLSDLSDHLGRLPPGPTPPPAPVVSASGTGALPPTEDIEAEIQREQEATPSSERPTLPPAVDLTGEMPPIRNQGLRGTCVAFALTTLHEVHWARKGVTQDFSEQFLYAEAKKIDLLFWICGTWLIRAATVLDRKGQCPEATWPYRWNTACNDHGEAPPDADEAARPNRAKRLIVGLRSVRAAKAALADGLPVGFSMPVFSSWTRSLEAWRSGRVTLPLDGEASDGGHAVCLVGYRDDPAEPGGGVFILRNSWGETFGSQSPHGRGYGVIPYAYVDKHGWEMVALKDA